jgi:hypothetical protein
MSNQEIPTVWSDCTEELPSDSPISCPACGGSSLHHGKITSFYRAQEDEPSTAITIVGTAVIYKHDADDNPSLRRDGITIDMKCESCTSTLQYSIWQHKGSTYFGWSKVVPDLSL